MTTSWTLPTIVTQYAEEGGEIAHISWNDQDNFSSLKTNNGKFLETSRSLQHIARSPKYDIRMKTYYIRATGFEFQNLPKTISGIEARLSSDRRGRVADETIQLCIDNELAGENHATLPILPIKVYGSSTDLWSIQQLSLQDIQNSAFGIIIRLQSHPHWPHNDPAFIDAIELRIH